MRNKEDHYYNDDKFNFLGDTSILNLYAPIENKNRQNYIKKIDETVRVFSALSAIGGQGIQQLVGIGSFKQHNKQACQIQNLILKIIAINYPHTQRTL